jgi:hypothetical protein
MDCGALWRARVMSPAELAYAELAYCKSREFVVGTHTLFAEAVR